MASPITEVKHCLMFHVKHRRRESRLCGLMFHVKRVPAAKDPLFHVKRTNPEDRDGNGVSAVQLSPRSRHRREPWRRSKE